MIRYWTADCCALKWFKHPPDRVLALGLPPHALVMPGWPWALSLAAFGLAPRTLDSLGLVWKKHWKGLKLVQHTWGFTGLSAQLFILWNPDLPESQIPLPGLCWRAQQKCPFRCLPHTCVTQEKLHSCPPTRPTGWSSDGCTSKRNTQIIARPCQEGSYCTGLWQTAKNKKKNKKKPPNPPNPYKHLPSRVSVLKANIRCRD